MCGHAVCRLHSFTHAMRTIRAYRINVLALTQVRHDHSLTVAARNRAADFAAGAEPRASASGPSDEPRLMIIVLALIAFVCLCLCVLAATPVQFNDIAISAGLNDVFYCGGDK